MLDLASLSPNLPLIITRQDVPKYFGSYISYGYLANLDSLGKGPKKSRIGKKIIYHRDDFLAWLGSRMKEA